tara:strand:+ start:1261 stop:1683 length:423 start_codon:yes stop_codon:yes gene_type:complete
MEKYYNNKINELVSKETDRLRTIMDIDGIISKYGCNLILMYDYKSINDTTTTNTLSVLSNFSNIKLNDNRLVKTFIINEKQNMYIITEIKYVGVFTKVKSDYIEKTYKIHKGQEQVLIDFLSPEKHNKTKQILNTQTELI